MNAQHVKYGLIADQTCSAIDRMGIAVPGPHVRLGTSDKKASGAVKVCQALEVHVTAIHDVECAWLWHEKSGSHSEPPGSCATAHNGIFETRNRVPFNPEPQQDLQAAAKLSMISTVTNRGEARWMIIDGNFSADRLIEFLEASIKDAVRKLFLFLDNSRAHHLNL